MVTMSMYNSQYVLIHLSQSQYQYDFSESVSFPFKAQEDDLYFVLDHLLHDPLEAARRRSERAITRVEQMAVRLLTLEADLFHERALRTKFERDLKRERLQAAYRMWEKECEFFFVREACTALIIPPIPATQCQDKGCQERKSDKGGTRTCKHDMKSMLQGCERYNAAFLEGERLRWHPDKLARKCDESMRAEIMAKAGRCPLYSRNCIRKSARRLAQRPDSVLSVIVTPQAMVSNLLLLLLRDKLSRTCGTGTTMCSQVESI
jgi:hypothetical protein